MSTRILVSGIGALAGLLAFGLAGTALAFHDGGVAHCDRCHSMHSSTHANLLVAQDQSSTCLACHEGAGSPTSYHVMSGDASVWSPGGDFFWLTQSYSNTVDGTVETSDPDRMGHNIIAGDQSLIVDQTNTTAPMGTYPSGQLGCHSCHDPHGQVNGGTANGGLPVSVSGSYGEVPPAGTVAGNYRLLGDAAYGRATAPVAVIDPRSASDGPGLNGAYGEIDTHHVAYGQNMSEWCGSCHPDALTGTKHPAENGENLNGEANNYNGYVATGDFTGSNLTSYLALVPFELQTDDKAVLLARSTSTEGPDASSNVMCLSCHRAHASAFNYILRWDITNAFLVQSLPNAANLAAMGALPNSAYYGRVIATDFGDYQRSLCNKCHVKD
jgi:predicted CXXCH cytochrome family protein